MAIPDKITPDFYRETIQVIIDQPLNQRSGINGMPCVWIQNLEATHTDPVNNISVNLKNSLKSANREYGREIDRVLIKRIITAAFGFAVGFGGCLAILAGGGTLSIVLGIAGVVVGGVLGWYVGVLAARAEASKKTLPQFHKAFKIEMNWVKGKIVELGARIALNDPDDVKDQLTKLQTYFQGLIIQEKALAKIVKQ